MNHRTIPVALTAVLVTMFSVGSPLYASETDNRIETTFRQSFVYRTYLKDDSVTTVAKEGVVTLTGTVSDEAHKTLAQDTAASLPGVTRVDNQLVTKSEAATEKSDLWIARKLKLALLFHRHVNASATIIEVKDGAVVLRGESISAAQRDLTGEYAKDIEGVTSVKNEMTLVAQPAAVVRTATEKIDDASITAQVKAALATHRSTRAFKTVVEARSGEVTLTGIATNPAEKALVTKLVTDIHGVTSVNNKMTVAEPMTK